jgi:hypothetical protein
LGKKIAKGAYSMSEETVVTSWQCEYERPVKETRMRLLSTKKNTTKKRKQTKRKKKSTKKKAQMSLKN